MDMDVDQKTDEMEAVAKKPRYQLREVCKTPSKYRDYEYSVEPFRQPPQPQLTPNGRNSNRSTPKKATKIISSSSRNLDQCHREKLSIRRQKQNLVVPSDSSDHQIPADLSKKVQKLERFLNLSKARRFIFCEFFYSQIDSQLFLNENDFSVFLRQHFSGLKCRKLKKPEWREIRRLIGKPRRFSQTFLDEERASLEAKRQKMRSIYNGSCIEFDQEIMDLPSCLPIPPALGGKVYVRLRSPNEGIYAATIDAISDARYHVTFDLQDIKPTNIPDTDLMYTQSLQLLPINSLIEINRANKRGNFPGIYLNDVPTTAVAVDSNAQQSSSEHPKTITSDEKVGNFPAKLLVILVKLFKLIEYKREFLGNIIWMNDNAEKVNLFTNTVDTYPNEFKHKYAQIILDLDFINRLLKTYLTALSEYYDQLLPHLSQPQISDQPDALRRMCQTHAIQIVKRSNSELNVRSNRGLGMSTQLISLLKQLRTIGSAAQNQKRLVSAFEANILAESLNQLATSISPKNHTLFQNEIQVHFKEIIRMITTNSRQH